MPDLVPSLLGRLRLLGRLLGRLRLRRRLRLCHHLLFVCVAGVLVHKSLLHCNQIRYSVKQPVAVNT